MDIVLEADSIVTRFGTDVIHDGVSFRIERGQVVALIGGSGTGKSVLLKEMIGLLRPTAGRARLFGEDVCFQALEFLVAGARVTLGPFGGALEGIDTGANCLEVEQPTPHLG